MTNPKIELKDYLNKLIRRFVFIKHIYDELEKINSWIRRPNGIKALEEGASFFNLFQRTSNQTFLIEMCKFIDEEEQKSLRDFLIKCKQHAKSLEPTSLITEEFPRKILAPEKYGEIIDRMIKELDSHSIIITNLKARRDKALAHTDASFFNNPDKHFETYPLMVDDIKKLLHTVEEILEDQALYILQIDYDFKSYTVSGIDRVIEFMRAYYSIIKEDSEKIRYRFDEYYEKKE